MNYKTLSLLIICCIFAVPTSLNAQKKLSNKVGITFSSLGTTDIFGETNNTNYNFEGKSFYALGVNYIRGLNKWLELETGVEYSKYNINMKANAYPGMIIYMRTNKTELALLGVPATLRANFLKYFFVNAGLLIDIDLTDGNYLDNQTGFGGVAGFGVNYNFDFGLSVFLNPYIKAHSWIGVESQQKILEKGFRLGVTYDLHRIIKK
jgi:hypothetical protein